MTNHLKTSLTYSITLLLILFSLNGLAEDYILPIDCSLEQCKKLAEYFAKKAEKEKLAVELYEAILEDMKKKRKLRAKLYRNMMSEYNKERLNEIKLNIKVTVVKKRISEDNIGFYEDLAGIYSRMAGIEETDTCGEIEDQAQGEIEDPVVN